MKPPSRAAESNGDLPRNPRALSAQLLQRHPEEKHEQRLQPVASPQHSEQAEEQNRSRNRDRCGKVSFESEKLDDLRLKLKNVSQLFTAELVQIRFEGSQRAAGVVSMDPDLVYIQGHDPQTLPRSELLGITPGGRGWLDTWSGKFVLGYALHSGNTDAQSLNVAAELDRRLPSPRSSSRSRTSYCSTSPSSGTTWTAPRHAPTEALPRAVICASMWGWACSFERFDILPAFRIGPKSNGCQTHRLL